MSKSLECKLISALEADQNTGVLPDSSYEYKSVFLDRIVPDKDNPRFFPSIIISDHHAYLFSSRQLSKHDLIGMYRADDKVLIGKSCIINCCERGSNEWKKASKSVDSIIELAENIAVSEIIQVPTLFPIEDQYQILTGHRRFFAMIYTHGVSGAAHFKVYHQRPLLQKTKQFQENSSREDLPQYGKLQAFQDAINEISILSRSRQKLGLKALTSRETASHLGISMGAYDNYRVLTRYPAVSSFYEQGGSDSFVKVKKLILETESQYRLEFGKKELEQSDQATINERIDNALSSHPVKDPVSQSRSSDRPYNINGIRKVSTVKTLLTSNIIELCKDIDWSKVDWDDGQAVQDVLKVVVEYLDETLQET